VHRFKQGYPTSTATFAGFDALERELTDLVKRTHPQGRRRLRRRRLRRLKMPDRAKKKATGTKTKAVESC